MRRGRQSEENISHSRTVLSPRFLCYSSLMEKRYLAMRMWLCEGEREVKLAHFRLPSASQKRSCLSSLLILIAVHVRYKSLYISLLSSAKQQREMGKFFEVLGTSTATAEFSCFLLELNAVIAYFA